MPTLTLQQLNRATLARQLLLERSQLAVAPAVAQVAGLQAQVQNPPYIGLWTRLVDLRREAVTEAMERREIVRATMMRSTIHLATGDDYLVFWPALRPALVKALRAFFGDRARRLDIPSIVAAAEPFFAQGPRTFVELRATFLVDGMVAGAWKVERAKKAATLVIEPFIALDAATRSGLSDEGERLLRWAEEGPSYNIRFADVA